MLTDDEIRAALHATELEIDPLMDDGLKSASYDFHVGKQAFVSGGEEIIDAQNKGLVILDPGEFAVVTTRERVRCGPQIAGQLGLSSEYARQGLVLLSGPQVDPGFDGVLIVRVTNLAPSRVTLPYEAPFLTVQFFRLNHPVKHPYAGSRQGQTGLRPSDLQALSNPESPTLGGMVKSLQALARDVSHLQGSIGRLSWSIPLLVAFGIAIMAAISAMK